MLDWHYEGSIEVATYRGFRVEAHHDDHPGNPFEEWDSHWPMLVRYDGRTKEYDRTKTGVALCSPIWRFTNEHLVFDQIAIADALGTTIAELTDQYTDEAQHWCTDADLLRAAFTLVDIRGSRELEVLAELYELLGIPCLYRTSYGDVQSAVSPVLIVATPEAQAEFGVTEPVKCEDLEAQFRLYGDWAWGRTYGWVIPEQHDSMWGYYGDHDDSGLNDAVMDAVDQHIWSVRKKRSTQLARMIRNKVPLRCRQEGLDQFGTLPHAA